MYALVLIESCCYHFNGVLATGTKEECDQAALDYEFDFPDGYHMSVVAVGHDRSKWAEVRPVEGVTLNGGPIVPLEHLQEEV